MDFEIISEQDLVARSEWVSKIRNNGKNFGDDARKLYDDLGGEIKRHGLPRLLMHVRLCGAIPEDYGHDSSEEKLYSKYTDCVLAYAFQAIGLRSVVLDARGDSADVEAVCEDYSFVADAKAFRLSRTAKNQKDFKIQAIDGWRRDKKFAIVVAPSYQMPARISQIYEQAIARHVCILSYAHLGALIQYSSVASNDASTHQLHEMLRATTQLMPSKDARNYWSAINRAMAPNKKAFGEVWREEKIASIESIHVAKEEALFILSQERTRIMHLSHQQAIHELMAKHNIASREAVIRAVVDNGILAII